MKRCSSAWLALASAALAAASLQAVRPHYGGVLRVEAGDQSVARDRVTALALETLTRVDAGREPQPLLATDWQREASGTRWRFRIRRDVTLHNGATLEAWQAATALRAVERKWTVAAEGDQLIIDLPQPADDLPWTLAAPTHAITLRPAGDVAVGTGPFKIERLDSTGALLRAHDAYRDGRPFLDTIQVQFGRSAAAQLADLEAGRADFVSVQSTDARRLTQRRLRVFASSPLEVVALVFEPHRAGDALEPARRALSRSINRATIAAVLLQERAAPASTLLPSWLSRLPAPSSAPPLPASAATALPADFRELVLRVDSADALMRLIADRIAVDAREAGFNVKIQAAAGLAPRPDARLVRVPLVPAPPDRSFNLAMAKLVTRPADPQPESRLIEKSVVVPIVHLPELYAASDRVAFWARPGVSATGAWNFADLWLEPDRP